MLRVRLSFISLLLFLLPFILISCSSKDSAPNPADTGPVIGRITLGEPVKSATLRITDANNKLLYEKANLPMRQGSRFMLEDAPSLPADVRFYVDQIVLNSGPFSGTLSARYQNFKRNLDVVNIHAVTTLLERYQQRHNSETVTKINDRIQSCLSIGAGVNLFYGVNHTNQFFDHSAFSVSAFKNGGFEAFVQSHIASIEAGTACPYPGKAVASKASLLRAASAAEGDILDAVGNKLFDYALNKGIDDATGWVLSYLTGGDSGDNNAAIESMLAVQTQMLQQIDNELQGLSNQITTDTKAILSEVDYTAFQTDIAILQTVVSTVNQYFEQLTWYSEEKPGTQTSIQQNLLLDLISNIQFNLGGSLDTLNADLVGTLGTKGLIKSEFQILLNNARWDSQYYPQKKAFLDYFKAVQLKAALLLAESYHASGLPQAAQSYTQTYTTNTTTQYQLLPVFPPAATVIDMKSGLMWQQKPGPPQGSPEKSIAYCNQLNLGGYNDWRMTTTADQSSMHGGNQWSNPVCPTTDWYALIEQAGFDLSNFVWFGKGATECPLVTIHGVLVAPPTRFIWASDLVFDQVEYNRVAYSLDLGYFSDYYMYDLANNNLNSPGIINTNVWCVRGPVAIPTY